MMKNCVKYFFSLAIILLLATCNPIENRVSDSIAEAFKYRYENADSCIFKTKKLLQDPTVRKSRIDSATIYNNLAYTYFLKSDFITAKKYTDSACLRANDTSNMEFVLAHLIQAKMFQRQCEYDTALLISNKLKHFAPKITEDKRAIFILSQKYTTKITFAYYYKTTESTSFRETTDVLNELDNISTKRKKTDGTTINLLDSAHLAYICYVQAGAYYKFVDYDSTNYSKTLCLINDYLSVYWNINPENNYYNANIIQLLGEVLQNNKSRNQEYSNAIAEIKRNLQGKVYFGSDTILSLLMKADSLFKTLEDEYQKLGAKIVIAEYYRMLYKTDTNNISANDSAYYYYLSAIDYDDSLKNKNARSFKLAQRLYSGLLTTMSIKDSAISNKYYRELDKINAFIAKKEKNDAIATNNAIKQKEEQEKWSYRSYAAVVLVVVVLLAGLFFYFNFQTQKKHRKNFANIAQITPKIYSYPLDVYDMDATSKFVEKIYNLFCREFNIFERFPDFSIILYCHLPEGTYDKEKKNGDPRKKVLGRIALEKRKNEEKITTSFSELDVEKDKIRPAVGCFLDAANKEHPMTKNKIIEKYTFHNWIVERGAYLRSEKISESDSSNVASLSDFFTRSLIFAPLISKENEVIGIFSFQTIQSYAFKHRWSKRFHTQKDDEIFIDTFKIIAETVQASVDNSMQHHQLQEQKRKLLQAKFTMELQYSILRHDVVGRFKMLQTMLSTDLRAPAAQNDISEVIQAIIDLYERLSNWIEKENFVSGKLKCKKKEMSLWKCVEKLQNQIRAEDEITISYDFPKEHSIFADEMFIEIILRNLITNAIKHSGGSEIKTYLEEDEENMIIAIEDNGCGIPSEKLPEFLNILNKAKGLGLYIAKVLSQAQGGDLRIEECKQRKGTKFQILLPKI